jgi:hypothetical protein
MMLISAQLKQGKWKIVYEIGCVIAFELVVYTSSSSLCGASVRSWSVVMLDSSFI